MAGGAQITADLPSSAWRLLAALVAWPLDMQQASDMRTSVVHSREVVDKVRCSPPMPEDSLPLVTAK